MQNVVAFASLAEVGAGFAFTIAPAIVVAWMLGVEASSAVAAIGRCFGIALLALGVASWPSSQRNRSSASALPALLLYNAAIALYLIYLGTAVQVHGVLLWPVAALHAAMALLLIWAWRAGRMSA